MVRIAAVTHKPYAMPEDPLYIPLMAGAARCPCPPGEYVRDDTGDNISDRNGGFSELTGLYWLWKNHAEHFPDADYLGLCHYRRYFAVVKGFRKQILSGKDAEVLVHRCAVTLPKRRNYLIESNYSQYAHAHHAQDLDMTRQIICERYPDYAGAYDGRMKMRSGHRFNMFIMSRDMLDSYCEWLFDILFELESRLDTAGYTGRDRRVFGLVSERLLDVWIDKNRIQYREQPYIMTEKEGLLLKGLRMTGRKLKSAVRPEGRGFAEALAKRKHR